MMRALPLRAALRSLLLVAALAAPAAHAASMSTHTVVMTLTLDAATYDFDGSAAPIEGFGFVDENIGTFAAGNASQSGSTTFTINGLAPSDPEDFEFAVGDSIEFTIVAQTSAEGLGASATHSRDVILDLEFEDFFDGTENITLFWSWSYTQDATLTNMADGDQAAAFLDASVLVSNFESFSDSFFFVEDENYANTGADTDVFDLDDAGEFELQMDVEDGGATSTLVQITLDVGANSIIRVPEPRLAALLGSLTLMLLLGGPREL